MDTTSTIYTNRCIPHQESLPKIFDHPNKLTSNNTISSDSSASSDGKWAFELLRSCVTAMSENDSGKIHHLFWMLNELSSPYGDFEEKLAYYFFQALFFKATNSGRRCYEALTSATVKSYSFAATRRLILEFQDVSPWTTFGHVASNGAMLEVLEGFPKLHIVDISDTLCTQWPTFLEALATRNDETPRMRLTAVVAGSAGSFVKDITPRMEKFARLMAVPFEFEVITSVNDIKIRDDELIAVNFVGRLGNFSNEETKSLVNLMKSVKPKVIVVVEEKGDFLTSGNDSMSKIFEECLRFYTSYFEMLDESFPPTSESKLMLEKECFRSIIRVLSCHDHEMNERRAKWSEILSKSGFSIVSHSKEVIGDVKALLKRYTDRWSLRVDENSGVSLVWKEEPVVLASVWEPNCGNDTSS